MRCDTRYLQTYNLKAFFVKQVGHFVSLRMERTMSAKTSGADLMSGTRERR